jgi:hypothetical protein
MKDKTKQLCQMASRLFQSKRIHRSALYEMILNTNLRLKEVSRARQMIGYILYNHYGFTLKEVVVELNCVNHSTAIYWLDRVHSDIKGNTRVKSQYDYIMNEINGIPNREITECKTNQYALNIADIDFIELNIDKYNVSEFADILKKYRNVVKKYIDKVKK